jgi:cyclophilin family peptidyl-prolyl cis-trans isomerase
VPIDNARRFAVLVSLAALLAACGQPGGSAPAAKQAAPAAKQAAPAAQSAAITGNLKPLPDHETDAPPLTKKSTVRMQTTAGELVIDVFPDAAPHAAQRFLELVSSGFYDDTPISRVVPDFVAQFGVNWREPHKAWKDKDFEDDPTYYALERGTLAFAKSGANMNSTQVFINYKENNRLAEPRYNFTVFGEIVSGMDVVDKFARVGDPSLGLDQNRLWQDGGAYLDSLTEKPTMIQHAEVVGAAN